MPGAEQGQPEGAHRDAAGAAGLVRREALRISAGRGTACLSTDTGADRDGSHLPGEGHGTTQHLFAEADAAGRIPGQGGDKERRHGKGHFRQRRGRERFQVTRSKNDASVVQW